MTKGQREQRTLPGALSSRAKAARRAELAGAPKNQPLRGALPRASWFSRARDVALGAHFPKITGGADPCLFGTVFALIMLGVVMVYSASSVTAVRMFGDGHHFFVRQAIYAAVGLPVMLVLARFDYHRLRGLGLWALFGAGSLLLAVVLGAGRNAGGAARWIQLGPINIQPAEVTKVALILWLSESLAKKSAKIRSFEVGFLPHVIVVAGLVGLCMAQPDFGSSVVLVLLTFVLLFVAGVKLGYMLVAAAVGLPLVYVALRFESYRWQRIVAFLDPFKHRMTGGYQIVESWYSFGAGGLYGVGLGDSRQKLLFLPEAHTDFIAAIVAEELGFIGFSLLVLGFVIVILRGLSAAFRAPEAHGMYLGIGLTLFIGVQAMTNLAVVLGLLPTKGLTLPFLSFGGSSLLVNCAAVGILLNVSRPRVRSADDTEAEPLFAGLALGFGQPKSRASNPRVRKPELGASLTAERGVQ
ncbi:MAG TPA: putative lipid II flippase FtsW [Polyangiales bacterium]